MISHIYGYEKTTTVQHGLVIEGEPKHTNSKQLLGELLHPRGAVFLRRRGAQGRWEETVRKAGERSNGF